VVEEFRQVAVEEDRESLATQVKLDGMELLKTSSFLIDLE
jgi:hypothetical protein